MLESSIPKTQVFSYGIVEAKRFRRTLTAVINGKTVPQAVREGLVEMDEDQQGTADYNDVAADDESLFVPEKQAVSANPFANAAEQVTANPFAKPVEQVTGNPFARTTEEASTVTFGNPATSAFNPQAPAFAPGMLQQPSGVSAYPFASPGPFNPFVTKSAQASTNPFTNSGSPFPSTAPAKVDSPTTAAKTANSFSKINSGNGSSFTPQSTPPKSISQPFVFGAEGFNPSPTAAPVNSLPATSTATAPNNSFSFTPFTSPTSTWISTPSQPPAFSWPKVEENTQENIQNTGTWRTFRYFCSFTAASKMLGQASIYCSPCAPRSRSSHFGFSLFKTRLNFHTYTFIIIIVSYFSVSTASWSRARTLSLLP